MDNLNEHRVVGSVKLPIREVADKISKDGRISHTILIGMMVAKATAQCAETQGKINITVNAGDGGWTQFLMYREGKQIGNYIVILEDVLAAVLAVHGNLLEEEEKERCQFVCLSCGNKLLGEFERAGHQALTGHLEYQDRGE